MTKPKKPTSFATSKQITKSEAVKKIVRVVRQHRLSYDAFIAMCQQVRLKLKMEKPKKERRLPELLSLAELKKFFKTVQKCGDTQHELMLTLMLYTAVRVSELVKIRVSDVDLGGCFRELGRVIRTMFLLNYISDVEVRRMILSQQTKVSDSTNLPTSFYSAARAS
jgi:integrase